MKRSLKYSVSDPEVNELLASYLLRRYLHFTEQELEETSMRVKQAYLVLLQEDFKQGGGMIA